MQETNRPNTQKRQELVQLITDLGLPLGVLTQYTAKMRGKTEAEQEAIAQQIIDELRERYPSN